MKINSLYRNCLLEFNCLPQQPPTATATKSLRIDVYVSSEQNGVEKELLSEENIFDQRGQIRLLGGFGWPEREKSDFPGVLHCAHNSFADSEFNVGHNFPHSDV